MEWDEPALTTSTYQDILAKARECGFVDFTSATVFMEIKLAGFNDEVDLDKIKRALEGYPGDVSEIDKPY